MSKLITLIEPQTNESLFSTDSFEEAYAKALEFEKLGIEVKVLSPSAPETLASMMGADREDLELLKEILHSELEGHSEDHDGREDKDSCCYSKKC